MDPNDSELFLQSLKAQTAPELVKTARLWEGELLQRYRVPFFLVRVGDIRAALNSTATALILYKEVRVRKAHYRFDYDILTGRRLKIKSSLTLSSTNSWRS